MQRVLSAHHDALAAADGLNGPPQHASLEAALARSARQHARLCPRQVLGARIGLAGTAALRAEAPSGAVRALVVVETDGCFVDGIEAATGCSVGHRTLRVQDYGKVAATCIDRVTGAAVRIVPRPDIRSRAFDYATPGERRRYYAQLVGYQHMPEHELLDVRAVTLRDNLASLIGRPGVRVECASCGDEVINAREVERDGRTLCVPCAQGAYYASPPPPPE